MRKIIFLVIAVCFLQITFAKTRSSIPGLFQKTTAGFIAYPQLKIVPVNTTHKKKIIKERRFLKLFLKFKKQNIEDAAKKKNKIRGIISAGSGGLSILFFILTLIFADGFLMLSWLGLSIIAIILGITVLKRSKKFHDKNNSGRSAGLAGIILGSIGFLSFIIWTIIEFNS